MRFVIFSVTLILTLCHLSGAAQNNFYEGEISQNGVTKAGFIKYNPKARNKSTISFKEKPDDQPTTLTARDIEGFKISRFNIHVISVPSVSRFDSLIFAELVIQGKASLAVNENEHILILDGQYLNMIIPIDYKRVNTLHEAYSKRIVDIREIGRVKNFLTGCDLKVDYPKLTNTSISEIVTEYNQCQSAPQTNRKSRKLYVEPVIGFTTSFLQFKGKESAGLENVKFDPSTALNFGVNLSFNSGSFVDRSILTAGLIVNENTFESTYRYYASDDDINYTERSKITLTRWKFPFMLKRYSSIGQQGFYYGGGLTPYIFREFKTKKSYVGVRDGVEVASGSTKFPADRRPYGGAISLISGYDLLLKNNMRILMGCSVDYDPGFLARSIRYQDKVFSFQINLGVRF
jgi:hypothetical protein